MCLNGKIAAQTKMFTLSKDLYFLEKIKCGSLINCKAQFLHTSADMFAVNLHSFPDCCEKAVNLLNK